MAVFDDLSAKIEEVRSVAQQAVVVLQDLRAQLENAGGAATEEQLRTAIGTIDEALAPLKDAIAPPAPPPEPAPAPTP